MPHAQGDLADKPLHGVLHLVLHLHLVHEPLHGVLHSPLGVGGRGRLILWRGAGSSGSSLLRPRRMLCDVGLQNLELLVRAARKMLPRLALRAVLVEMAAPICREALALLAAKIYLAVRLEANHGHCQIPELAQRIERRCARHLAAGIYGVVIDHAS